MSLIPDMGIYAIENVLTGRCYVGRSIQLSVRMQKHETGLAMLDHENIRIRADVRRDGPEAFRVVVLQRTLDSFELEYLEYMWARRLDAFAPAGYNGTGITKTTRNHNPTEEAFAEFDRLFVSLEDRGYTDSQIAQYLAANDIARPTGGRNWSPHQVYVARLGIERRRREAEMDEQ